MVVNVSIPPDAGTNGALTYTCTDGKSLIRTIYVAETPQGSNKDNNVCLVVGGTYAGSTNYYRVNLTAGGNYIPIKRDSRKRIGRGMGRRDGCRFGNDNFTLKGLFYLRTIWDGK